ncbi:ASCH domain-containing protein [Paenarthrobacter sp. Z7-10]|uniref:ASCH domain-containing protein n=1 Tax=Paenarthrobacter sp. Z7-10 TaxID=2787635 RepID=UPI0022A933C7|nr:ASCH domain-containing protein [Paenarthrobacter sp. Z7-10]MCZ2401606.1 ASCH domain-containing protein [Paenarthrobacter sp. Z7-10]
MSEDYSDQDLTRLPKAEFGFPGPLRDKLVAAILAGVKTSTTGLVADYIVCGEELPVVGERAVVIDSQGRDVAILEVTAVDVRPLGQVDLQHVLDEGEGHRSIAEWRADHEDYWHSPEMREAMGDPGFTVNDATETVLERFRLLTVLPR